MHTITYYDYINKEWWVKHKNKMVRVYHKRNVGGSAYQNNTFIGIIKEAKNVYMKSDGSPLGCILRIKFQRINNLDYIISASSINSLKLLTVGEEIIYKLFHENKK